MLPKDHSVPSESFDIVGMALMAPGLALFLYGVSSIPEQGNLSAPKVWATMLAGVALIAAFVVWSFRPQHPLLDLRLFKNRNLTLSVITMFLFAIAFFGGLLLLPTYLQNVRGEGAFDAGLLIAPQGIGAMLTMPLAGYLVDKFPVGRIVPIGVAIIFGGMLGLTTIEADTSYNRLIVNFVVLGLGMGLTMMPLMTAALRTLRNHEVARGSTMMNIIQQVASSVGVAVMSVLLTNGFKDSTPVATPGGDVPTALLAMEAVRDPDVAAQVPPEIVQTGLVEATDVFTNTFFVASILIAVTLAVSFLLPRKKEESHLLEDDGLPPVVMH